jgi:hypothetical protein
MRDGVLWPTEPMARADRARRLLLYGLALLWWVDGVLQLQPAMFTQQFVTMILDPAMAGQPAPIYALLRTASLVWAAHTAVLNVCAAGLQLAIGTAIALPHPTVRRAGLTASLVWALLVWIFGEGLGGLLAGGASWFLGGPGSALLYGWGSLLLLFPQPAWEDGHMGQRVGRSVALLAWLGAAYQSLASWWTPSALADVLTAQASNPQPSWLSGPIRLAGKAAALHPDAVNAGVVAVLVALGLLWWFGRHRWWTDVATVVWLLLVWWMGQDFGVLGGTGTDPNTIPILALLMASGRLLPRGAPSAPATRPHGSSPTPPMGAVGA